MHDKMKAETKIKGNRQQTKTNTKTKTTTKIKTKISQDNTT
jgi:hypothetical protein